MGQPVALPGPGVMPALDAPQKHATALINATQRRWLRPVQALSRQPFLRPDGTLCRSPGYDPDSQIYADFDAAQFPDIPGRPTREEAAQALELLSSLLKEMPFKSPVDHSAAVAMFLSATVRPALPTCPGFLINAHASGSGKSYLQDQAGAFATAETPLPSAAFIANDEELRKELLAKLLGAPAVIKWDEMKSDLLPVKALLSALSSELIEGRRLGSSQMIKVSTRTLMLFAGNNVHPVEDMTRLIISINLDPAMENPATREFARDPLSELHRDRGRYIMAALTIIRAWQMAGKPVTPGVKATVNGYHQWNDWCRLPLLWLGYPDPATNLFEALKSDPAKENLQRVMETWEAAFGQAATSVKQAIKKSESDELLREALLEVAEIRPGEIDAKKLGYYLKRSQGRRVHGRFFERDKSAVRNSNRYILRLIEAAPDSAPAPASPQPVLPSLTDSPAEATRSDSSDSAGSGLPAPGIAAAVSVQVPLPRERGQGESSHPSANPPGSGTKLPPIEGFEV